MFLPQKGNMGAAGVMLNLLWSIGYELLARPQAGEL
jgi:hypothetical protein